MGYFFEREINDVLPAITASPSPTSSLSLWRYFPSRPTICFLGRAGGGDGGGAAADFFSLFSSSTTVFDNALLPVARLAGLFPYPCSCHALRARWSGALLKSNHYKSTSPGFDQPSRGPWPARKSSTRRTLDVRALTYGDFDAGISSLCSSCLNTRFGHAKASWLIHIFNH